MKGLLFSLFCASAIALTWTPTSITPVGGTRSAPSFFWRYQGGTVVDFQWNKTQLYNTFSDFYLSGCRTDGIIGPMTVPVGNKKVWNVMMFQTHPCEWETIIRNGRFLGMDIILVATSHELDFNVDDWGGRYIPQLNDPLLIFAYGAAFTDQTSQQETLFNIRGTMPPQQTNVGECAWVSSTSATQCVAYTAISDSLGRPFWPFGVPVYRLDVTPSSMTGLTRQMGFQGSFVNGARWWSVIACMIILLMTTAKLYLFFHVQEKFALTLPIIVLGLCWLTGFFFAFGTIFFPTDVAIPYYVLVGLGYICWPLLWTACIVLGFYFRDVSTLTTSAEGTQNVLGKMLIPAVIVMTIVWAIFMAIVIYLQFYGAVEINSFFFGRAAQGYQDTQNQEYLVVQAAVSFACIIIVMAVLAFGAISIVMGSSGMSSEGKRTIYSIAGLSLFILLILGSFGIFFWTGELSPRNKGWMIGVPAIYGIMLWKYLIPTMHHLLIVVAMCFAFRVSVDKEIEMSKSGTSSTSGMSSSSSGGSSSSSSSSSRDPVIEL